MVRSPFHSGAHRWRQALHISTAADACVAIISPNQHFGAKRVLFASQCHLSSIMLFAATFS
jgi:hypothetical protein